jgi:hypothetical protein
VAKPTIPEVIAYQADVCAQSGSQLYARVLEGVRADLEAGGPCATVLRGHEGDSFGSALALRLLGAVHRIVLDGRAPALAACYPSAGGDPAAGDPAAAFVSTVREHGEEVARRLEDGVQTNEVGRSALLVGGFAEVARRTGLPLRVLEVGASAGLNLRWDHYAYDTREGVSGDPGSPVRFAGVWDGAAPALPASFEGLVAERRGCDRNPLDPTTDEGHRTLAAYVWPDQLERFERLRGAVEVARRVPATVVQADAIEWLEEALAEPAAGVATVVVHSIVLQYLPAERRPLLGRTITAAGQGATAGAPLAWLRMEPAGDKAELRLTTWPGGEERLLATSGFHGHPIRWLAR